MTSSHPSFLDITDPAFDFDGPAVAEARERHWYATTPAGPVVLRYAEATELVRDRRFASAGPAYMRMHGITSGPLYDWWTTMLQSVPAADHARIREVVGNAFTARRVEELRPYARRTADRLAAAIAPDTPCEFMDAFADPVPVWVMCRLLGVPTGDYSRFRQLSADVGLAFSRNLTALLPRVEAAIVGLSEYVEDLVERRREAPGDDLISALIRTEESSDRLSLDELRNLVLTLIFGAHDQPTRQFGRALVTFSEHPDQWDLLAARPDLAGRAAEEVMRYSTVSQALMRSAPQDLDFHGLHLPAGSLVLVCLPATHRDPRVFGGGERFDISVPRAPHQGFGGGIYHCLGAAVARVELAEGLIALTRAHGAPELAGEVTWRHPVAISYGPEVLPLRFRTRGVVAAAV
jgi:cytochrome P450